MQSGFGGIPEIQQFMVDNSAHPFFSISTTTPPPPNSIAAAPSHEIYHPSAITPTNKLFNTFHRQYSQPSPLPPPHFPHFHSNIPITQQLFTPPPHHHHHHHHHHLQLFHTNQENSVAPPPPFLPTDMKFKLAVDDNDVPTTILHADNNASESRLRSWHKEDNCAIKEPFWRPLDLDYINNNNNKRCKDKESAELCFTKRNRVTEEMENSHPDNNNNNNNNNYKIFSELEAIYKPGGSNSTATELPPNNHNQTTGSGSALTGDDHRLISPVATATFDLDYRLEDDNNSTGGEAQTILKKAQHHSRRRRRRRRRQMKSISAFFETLVKQLMDHQESLHHKFLNLMEQRDKDRILQEETRREQESARARRESIARAHDRELAAAREAAILSFLEKITGETINLPPYPNAEKNNDSISPATTTTTTTTTTNRWPKIEVQALIQVRSELDGQFQEPGLKGPLWEEVSTVMKTMGYNRNAKRCKEKWENINKYFRKNKDSGRKRSQQSKTCPYFHQLDQLYAKEDGRKVKNSELLDAVVVAGEAEEVEEEGDVEDDESSQFVELLQ